MSNNTIYERNKTMYQIIINNVRMPQIYWSWKEALEAIEREKERFPAIITEIVHIDQNQ